MNSTNAGSGSEGGYQSMELNGGCAEAYASAQ